MQLQAKHAAKAARPLLIVACGIRCIFSADELHAELSVSFTIPLPMGFSKTMSASFHLAAATWLEKRRFIKAFYGNGQIDKDTQQAPFSRFPVFHMHMYVLIACDGL